jgi:hypothetical protein
MREIMTNQGHHRRKLSLFIALLFIGLFLFPVSGAVEAVRWKISVAALGALLGLVGGIGWYSYSQEGEESTARLSARPYSDEPRPEPRDKRFLPTFPLIFLVPAGVAIFFELDILPKVSQSRFKPLLEHIVVALLIASFLSLTYEWFLSNRRESSIRTLLNQQTTQLEGILDKMLQQYAAVTPKAILHLIRDIATQTEQTPTLYRPPRNKDNEYTFANNVAYFHALVTFRRQEFCDIIREWLQDPNCPDNVKFLASDFIGRFDLHELRDELRNEAWIQRARWDDITDVKEKGWILNYIWAYSRTEVPRYHSLSEFLCDTDDEWAQAWILFIPRQMPEPELGRVIDEYLQRTKPISDPNLIQALDALHFLNSEHAYDAKGVIGRCLGRFDNPNLRGEVERRFGKSLITVASDHATG